MDLASQEGTVSNTSDNVGMCKDVVAAIRFRTPGVHVGECTVIFTDDADCTCATCSVSVTLDAKSAFVGRELPICTNSPACRGAGNKCG